MSTIEYTGLIVTTVELKTEKDGVPITSPQDNDGKTVYFTGNSQNGSKAYFLTNIKGTRTGRSWEFTATIVSPAKASEIVTDGFGNGKETIPLFCIHGHTRTIQEKLERVDEAKDDFKEAGTYYPVPVIWPTGSRDVLDYGPNQRSSEEAGKLFRSFIECIPNGQFPRKSLMMFSMGNFLVHSGKEGNPLDVQFDNIFMVAADIQADIFSDNPRDEEDKEKAENWKELLGKNGGKIFVFHSRRDLVLVLSTLSFNPGIQRIGVEGTTGTTRDEFTDVVENVNAREHVNVGFLGHNYQYEKWTIQQYNELSTKK